MAMHLNRWQASGVHLLCSFIVFLVILGFITFAWYPSYLINMGGWQGVKIVAVVDLVTGPLLTLIVYNTAKKSLKWDMFAIVALQIVCLSYGVWAVQSQRVVAQVLFDDKLFIYSKSDFQDHNVSMTQLRAFNNNIPLLVFLDMPEDRATIVKIIATASVFGEVPQVNTELYIPFQAALSNGQLKERLEWRLNRLVFDEGKKCYWTAAESKHYFGDACIHPAKGIVAIKAVRVDRKQPASINLPHSSA